MAAPGVIEGYVAELATRLPAPIVAELADGLYDTYDSYRHRGLAPDAAAQATVAEFGDPAVVVDAFVGANPARRSARSLLLTGPVVGGAWATVLITQRAWEWPVSVGARTGFAAAVLSGIVLLAIAGFADRYRRAVRSAVVACLVVAVVDATIVGYVAARGILMVWPVPVATALSITRLTFTLSRLARAPAWR